MCDEPATRTSPYRWNPILNVFDEVGVRFAHEVHPSDHYDYWTTVRTLEAIGHRPAWLKLEPVALGSS